MKNVGNEIYNIMKGSKHGEDFKKLSRKALNDVDVQNFFKEHDKFLNDEIKNRSISKIYEFVEEKNKVKNGLNSTVPGYEPKLIMGKGYIDIKYVPTKQKIQDIKYKKIQKRIELVSLPNSIRKIHLSDFIIRNNTSRRRALNYVKNMINNYEKNTSSYNKGIYLFGYLGLGKTFLMSAVTNKLAEDGYNVTFLNVPNFINDIKSHISDNKVSYYLDKVKKSPFLILDDIGAGDDMSSWVRDDILGVILDYRMQNYLPTSFTSNYSMDELDNMKLVRNNKGDEDPLNSERIMQRIRFLSEEIEMTGDSRRPQ